MYSQVSGKTVQPVINIYFKILSSKIVVLHMIKEPEAWQVMTGYFLYMQIL